MLKRSAEMTESQHHLMINMETSKFITKLVDKRNMMP